MSNAHPLVVTALAAGSALGRPGGIEGLNSWHDAAYFTSRAKTPTFSYGPPPGPPGMDTMHMINERMSVDELLRYCAILAVTMIRFGGGR
jgi:acetylornithine deacetylase/succinyl-diaminopimelate desuccinylase-like protein